MSKIQAELLAATGLKTKDGEGRPALLDRIVVAVNTLDDATWNKVSDPAANWFNAAMDVKNANLKAPASAKPIPDFPDFQEPAAAPAAPSRRRRSADEEDEPAAGPKVGDTCHVVSKKGREYTGEVVELDGGDIVLKVGDEEIVIGMDGATITVQGANTAAEEPAGPVEPKVGDTVRIINSRDREYTGEVVEMGDEDMTLKIGGELVDFAIEKLKMVKVVGGEAADTKKDEAPAGRSRRASTEDTGKAADAGKDADGKPKRSSNPKGISIGGRVRELMAEDINITQADVMKTMTKEGLAFRETSVDMIYKDTKALIELLKENKKLK